MLNIWGKGDVFKAPKIWAKVGKKILKNCWYKAGAKYTKRISAGYYKVLAQHIWQVECCKKNDILKPAIRAKLV